MKNYLVLFVLLFTLPAAQTVEPSSSLIAPEPSSENLFIITIDGFRWQELFCGADESLISNTAHTPDTATMKMLYGWGTANERRRQLLPFFWSVLAQKGQIYGNRKFDNKVNTSNLYSVSYPGYNEIFTGNTDIMVSSNKKKLNRNRNVLEFLNSRKEFAGKVAAFTSWDVFPYILNEARSGIPVNSGYEPMDVEAASPMQTMINKVQSDAVYNKGGTRYDQLTFLTAREYIAQHRPRIVFLGLGENDEFAHQGRYDLYLEQANKVDRMIAELWHWVQTTPGYKDNTSFLITTDHGRGSRDSKWTSHGGFIKGSSQTWFALIGPGIKPLGEIKDAQQFYQKELAGMIAGLVGENFGEEDVWAGR